MLNWIVWNRTVYMNKNGFSTKPKQTKSFSLFFPSISLCHTLLYFYPLLFSVPHLLSCPFGCRGGVEYTNSISAEGYDPPKWYDTKQPDGEIPVMLELWGMWSTPSLPSLPGQLWPVVVAPDRVLSMGQIKLNCILMLKWIVWNRTVLTCKLPTYAKMKCLK